MSNDIDKIINDFAIKPDIIDKKTIKFPNNFEYNDLIKKLSKYNISKLFKQATENMQDETASLAWETAVDNFSGNLNKEDKHAIKTLSKLLRNN